MIKLIIFLLIVLVAFWLISQLINLYVVRKWPPIGSFVSLNGMNIHYVDRGDKGHEDKLPIILLHGANGNLRDQIYGPGKVLEGRTRLIYMDRPGCGYSQRHDPSYSDPEKQAQIIVDLMDHLGLDKAIISGHSLGSAVAAAFAVYHPDRCAGLMLLAPASHPWPTGVEWYYKMAKYPLIASLFCHFIVPWVGWIKYNGTIKAVFHPNPVPNDYDQGSGSRLALRGRVFYNNAMDIVHLNCNVIRISKHYPDIKVPTIIITGDQDKVVMPEIHSEGLHRDIENSELIILPQTGHKPDVTGREEILAGYEMILKKHHSQPAE